MAGCLEIGGNTWCSKDNDRILVYFLRAGAYQGARLWLGLVALSDRASFSSSSGILVDSSISTSLQIVINLRDLCVRRQVETRSRGRTEQHARHPYRTRPYVGQLAYPAVSRILKSCS